jgi:hypothetical protein
LSFQNLFIVQRDIAEALSAEAAPEEEVQPQQNAAVRGNGLKEFLNEKVVTPIARSWHAVVQWLAHAWSAFINWTRLLGEYFKRIFLSRK